MASGGSTGGAGGDGGGGGAAAISVLGILEDVGTVVVTLAVFRGETTAAAGPHRSTHATTAVGFSKAAFAGPPNDHSFWLGRTNVFAPMLMGLFAH